jgi:replicative DNA helicase
MTLNHMDQYGGKFQIKVISSLLTHKEFLLNIHDILSDEYFSNNAHKWIIKEIMKYYEKYHTTPSMDVLKVELQRVTNDVLKVSKKAAADVFSLS